MTKKFYVLVFTFFFWNGTKLGKGFETYVRKKKNHRHDSKILNGPEKVVT